MLSEQKVSLLGPISRKRYEWAVKVIQAEGDWLSDILKDKLIGYVYTSLYPIDAKYQGTYDHRIRMFFRTLVSKDNIYFDNENIEEAKSKLMDLAERITSKEITL